MWLKMRLKFMFPSFLEFYEPASRQSSAPQAVRQREEVGPDLWPGAFINSYSQMTNTCSFYTNALTSACKINYNAYSGVRLQERFQVKNPPHTYIQKLRGYLDPGVTRKVGRYKWPFNNSLKENSTDFTHHITKKVFKAICQLHQSPQVMSLESVGYF